MDGHARVLTCTCRPLLAALALGFLALAGCGRSPARAYHAERKPADTPLAKQAEQQAAQPALSADAWLDRLAAAYAGAKSYADQGELLLTYPQNGREMSDRVSFAVQFERPGKLAAAIYQATLALDGQKMQARLDDLEGQTLTLPIPNPLTLAWLYQDPVLGRVLTEGLARSSPQLDLLLDGGSLAAIRKSASGVSLLDDQEIEGQLCVGVKLSHADGDLALWIDRESNELRRIDYPPGNLPPGGRLTATLRGARLNAELDPQVFALAAQDASRPVVRFVPPPVPLPGLLGQAPGEFALTSLDGSPLTKEALAGKTAVLEFWFKDCPPCPERMPRLHKVYEQFKDNDQVRFLTIAVDGPEVTGDQLQAKLEEWKTALPAARDARGQAAQAFQVQGYPHMIVLGPAGTVQALDTALGGELLPDLPALLERLIAGNDVASDLRGRFERHRQAYEQALADAAPGQNAGAEPVVAEIAPASEPTRIKLEKVWTNEELRFPGNILPIVEGDAPTRLLIADGAATVAELDAQGKLVAQHSLPIPEGALVTYLRTARDGQGRRYYAGSASGQPQAHVFDEQWNLLLSFPPRDASSAGLGDVRLADLDADGSLELVLGYWGEVGVQGVGFDGRRKWFNRAPRNVPSLALAPPEAATWRKVWALNEQGTILPIDSRGESSGPLDLPGRFLIALLAAGDATDRFAGLSIASRDRLTAVGFDAQVRESWHYALPPGVHRKPIEPLASGPVLRERADYWLLAGPDGSVHILSEQGDLLDHFAVGSELTGLAAAALDGKPTILTATPSGVSAWRIVEGE